MNYCMMYRPDYLRGRRIKLGRGNVFTGVCVYGFVFTFEPTSNKMDKMFSVAITIENNRSSFVGTIAGNNRRYTFAGVYTLACLGVGAQDLY